MSGRATFTIRASRKIMNSPSEVATSVMRWVAVIGAGVAVAVGSGMAGA